MQSDESIPIYSDHASEHARTTCVFCKNFHEFELPDHLLTALTQRRLVLFAGAGVTTESRLILPNTFYDDVRNDLALEDTDLPFPDLMSRYVNQPDGRRKLLEKIQSRFRYIKAFPELNARASRFHRELSTLFYIDTYVTTNWDDYFEVECGATPFVTGDDFLLWNVHGRKVFKIHGSIWNPGSIVATTEDYRRAKTQLEKGTLGSLLKSLIATRTILYAGYSFADRDFLAIHQYLRRELGAAFPAAYIVTIDRAHERDLRKLGLTPIFTDGAHFVSTLKRHLATEKHFLPDDRFRAIPRAHARVLAARARLYREYRLKSAPDTLYSGTYQDGLVHAFERMGAMRSSGEYSHACDVKQKWVTYQDLRKVAVRRGRFTDVAYIDGYSNGLAFLLESDQNRRAMPLYYVYGLADQPVTFEEYKRARKKAPKHVRALAYAKRTIEVMVKDNEIIVHPPHLHGLAG